MSNKKSNFDEVFYSNNYTMQKKDDTKIVQENNDEDIKQYVEEGQKKFIKINILIVICLLILFIVGTIIYIRISDSDSKTGYVSSASGYNKELLKLEDVLVQEETRIENEKESISKENIYEEKKKTLLEDMVDIFNNNKKKKELIEKGFSIITTVTNNNVNLYFNSYGAKGNVDFVLEDNILTAELLWSNKSTAEQILMLSYAMLFIDGIGQMKGYPEGLLVDITGEEEALNYTLENEGFQFIDMKPEKLQIKVDVNSNLPFMNK